MLTRAAKTKMISFRVTLPQFAKIEQHIKETKPTGLNGIKGGETSVGVYARKTLIDKVNNRTVYKNPEEARRAPEMYLANRADTQIEVPEKPKRRRPNEAAQNGPVKPVKVPANSKPFTKPT